MQRCFPFLYALRRDVVLDNGIDRKAHKFVFLYALRRDVVLDASTYEYGYATCPRFLYALRRDVVLDL